MSMLKEPMQIANNMIPPWNKTWWLVVFICSDMIYFMVASHAYSKKPFLIKLRPVPVSSNLITVIIAFDETPFEILTR